MKMCKVTINWLETLSHFSWVWNLFLVCHLQAVYESGPSRFEQCQTIIYKIARKASITIKSIWILIANSWSALINRLCLQTTGACLWFMRQPENSWNLKRRSKGTFYHLFCTEGPRKGQNEQKTGRRNWILWQLCEICQKFEGWRESSTSSWTQQIILFQF